MADIAASICPVCEGGRIEDLARRDATPVFQNGLYSSAVAAQACATGPLDLARCGACGFVWNRAFRGDLIDYGPDYDNSQTHSDAFLRHLEGRLSAIEAAAPEGPLQVLEVGCGQGDFLTRLIDRFGTDRVSAAIGFDPAFRGDAPAGTRIVADYFTADAAAKAGVAPDLVVSRHTIEHIPDPVDFLRGLRAALPLDAEIPVFLETPTVEWILRNGVVHDLFYEHCTLFTPGSIALALERSGFRVARVETCFDGQYLWAEAVTAGGETLTGGEAAYKARWRALADAVAGPAFIWGAGAKGATFAMLVDPEGTRFAGVVDKNPAKQGRYIAHSGHSIVAPSALIEADPAAIFVMNPNYAEEISAELTRLGVSAEIVLVH